MSTDSVSTGPDPLKAVADALDAAAKAASEGVQGAKSTIAGAVPEVEKQASRLVYNACYYLSYGVVFPTALLVRAVPKDNAIVHGFVDGANAAFDLVSDMKAEKSVQVPTTVSAELTPEPKPA